MKWPNSTLKCMSREILRFHRKKNFSSLNTSKYKIVSFLTLDYSFNNNVEWYFFFEIQLCVILTSFDKFYANKTMKINRYNILFWFVDWLKIKLDENLSLCVCLFSSWKLTEHCLFFWWGRGKEGGMHNLVPRQKLTSRSEINARGCVCVCEEKEKEEEKERNIPLKLIYLKVKYCRILLYVSPYSTVINMPKKKRSKKNSFFLKYFVLQWYKLHMQISFCRERKTDWLTKREERTRVVIYVLYFTVVNSPGLNTQGPSLSSHFTAFRARSDVDSYVQDECEGEWFKKRRNKKLMMGKRRFPSLLSQPTN